jgi:adenylosuccinate lyase/3-carboxy-cis,cis-muconate cycloisomerase
VPLALEAMVRMDEGDSSATNVSDILLPELGMLAASVADTLARLAEGLVVDTHAMQRNLRLTQGLINAEALMMRLSPVIGRHEAHRLVYEAAQHAQGAGLPFIDCVMAHPELAAHARALDLAGALEPRAHLGESSAIAAELAARFMPPR